MAWESTVSGIIDILLIVVLVAMVGGISAMVLYLTKFKYKVRIREVVNGRKIIIDDKAKEVKKSDGQKYWQTLKTKHSLPLPPSEAIDITEKGKKLVEVYLTEQGEFHYIKDDAKVQELAPMPTEQREMVVNQIVSAQKRKNRKWQDQLVPIVALGSLVILVVCLLVFWESMAEPLLQMADKQKAFVDTQKEIVDVLQQIENKVQVIGGEDVANIAPDPNG